MQSAQASPKYSADQIRKHVWRDLIVLLVVLLLATAAVFVFDTGQLARWIGEHRDSKVDEIVVVAVVLVIGLAVLSVRRWRDLSRQLRVYDQLYRDLDEVNRQSAFFGELNDLLQSCLSLDEAHKLITDRAQILFPGSSGAVCITASSRDVVEIVASWGNPSITERYFSPKECWALRRGRIHTLKPGAAAVPCGHMGEVHPDWSICLPMMAHGETLGLLYIDSGTATGVSAGPKAELTETQQAIGKTLAEHAALALANLNLREILKMQSVRDPLTGLFNRRYMEESLERELRRAVRKKLTLGVIMLDVDHFKRFNDTFGHEAGDLVLRGLASLFRSHFRAEDIVSRFGGEEFTIILPDSSAADARERAEQLRQAATDMTIQFHGQTLEPITLSMGISSFPENGSSCETLLRSADAALYRAKEQGRDRVVSANVS